MKNIITILCITLSYIGFSQSISSDIVQITLIQKQEILNYDYSSYQGNQKTIGDFLLEIPHVNNTIYIDAMYREPQMGSLRGLDIYLETTDGEEILIILYNAHLQHMDYDDPSTWTMDLLKLEIVEGIEILDYSLYSPLVLHID